MANRISTIFDFSESGGLRKLKADVAAADTSMGKFKAAAGGAFSTAKAHAAEFAIAAGAALVTFGVKAVQAFTDSALAAGKFADATGLANEDASRWIEVSSDVGVSAETIEGAFIRLQRAVAGNSPAFQELGIEIARTADGTVDANGTMLNAIATLKAIPDSTKRAEAAAMLFGRGFAGAAEIVLSDATDIEAALKGVSEAQVFDDDEVRKARELRAAMDNLKDKIEQFTMAVGEGLVPAVTDAVDQLTMLADAAEKLKLVDLAKTLKEWDFVTPMGQLNQLQKLIQGEVVFSLSEFTGSAEELRTELEALGAKESDIVSMLAAYAKSQAEAAVATEEGTEALAAYKFALDDGTSSAAGLDSGMISLEDALSGVATESDGVGLALEGTNSDLRKQREAADSVYDGINKLKDAYAKLRGELSDESAYLDVQDGFEDVQTAAEDAYIAAVEGADDAASKARDYRQAQISLNESVLDYAENVGDIPPETVTEILAMIDEGLLAEAQAKLDALAQPKNVYMRAVVIGDGVARGGRGQPMQAFDTGGVVQGPRGSEQVVIAHAGETVLPTHKGPVSLGGASPTGSTFNITINAGKADGPEVARLVMDQVKKYERANGAGWRR